METEHTKALAKIILLLQTDHHGCKQEALNIAKESLGIEVEHNSIREMINEISDNDIDRFLSSIE
ncbi:hypothetical protein QWY77_06120 [Thalassotalea ponticola]|uniref:hypothetical protein n=1 Tax=Thalassotalea ponticola TaxID=1523392 RepID=UPI0025B52E34|nr:hypothetical protein [Thalassotalea ponticola]MDN3652336.1 hypothetical protein [Thalassotalea ponticola]